MYEVTTGQVALLILGTFAVLALARWCQKRDDQRAALAVTGKAKSLFAWQFSTMLQSLEAARYGVGSTMTKADMAFLRMEARNIRGRVGVGEIIDPTPDGEALLIQQTVEWCAAILDTGVSK